MKGSGSERSANKGPEPTRPRRRAARQPAATTRSRPSRLALQQRQVGRAEQVVVAHAVPGRGGDAGRQRQVELARARPSATAARTRSAISTPASRSAPGSSTQELLAADPVDELERAQRLADLVGGVAQHGVAALVAVLVVDPLEAVEVEQHDGHRAAGQARLLLDLGDARLERRAVEQAGERVEHGPVAVLELAAASARCRRRRCWRPSPARRSSAPGRRPRPSGSTAKPTARISAGGHAGQRASSRRAGSAASPSRDEHEPGQHRALRTAGSRPRRRPAGSSIGEQRGERDQLGRCRLRSIQRSIVSRMDGGGHEQRQRPPAVPGRGRQRRRRRARRR